MFVEPFPSPVRGPTDPTVPFKPVFKTLFGSRWLLHLGFLPTMWVYPCLSSRAQVSQWDSFKCSPLAKSSWSIKSLQVLLFHSIDAPYFLYLLPTDTYNLGSKTVDQSSHSMSCCSTQSVVFFLQFPRPHIFRLRENETLHHACVLNMLFGSQLGQPLEWLPINLYPDSYKDQNMSAKNNIFD